MSRTILSAILLLTATAHLSQVGVNGSAEEEREGCPGASVWEGGGCRCEPGMCPPTPACATQPKIKTQPSGHPPDCCPLYECPQELNCTGVVCAEEEPCPSDSYRLPGLVSGCCSVGQGCACLPGPCPPPPPGCSPIAASSPAPGRCCPNYSCPLPASCTEGKVWGVCDECTCRGGVVLCGQCPTQPPLHGCRDPSGRLREPGEKWQEDDCTSCVCKGGMPKCQAALCSRSCPNATYIKGECCPRCANGTSVVTVPPECTPLNDLCPLRCRHGFIRDANGCFLCHCKEEEGGICLSSGFDCSGGFARTGSKCECCPLLENCPRSCPHGYRTNRKGCPVCKCKHVRPNSLAGDITTHEPNHKNYTSDEDTKVCEFGGRVKLAGDSWEVDRGCLRCWCTGSGTVRCRRGACPPAPCPRPQTGHGSCCPTCPALPLPQPHAQGCGFGRGEGMRWREGPCVSCVCLNGEASCYTESCDTTADTTCTNLISVDNQCCPLCLDSAVEESLGGDGCVVGNATVGLGEAWSPQECVRCVCGPGRTVTCDHTPCHSTPSPPCSQNGLGGWSVVLGFAVLGVVCFLSVAAFGHRACPLRRHKLSDQNSHPARYRNIPTKPTPPV